MTNLECLDERHRSFVLDQLSLNQQLLDLGVINFVLLLRVCLLDDLHTRILPFGEGRSNIYANSLGLLRIVKSISRRLLSLCFRQRLQQRNLSIANCFDRSAHILTSFNESRFHGIGWCGPYSQLYGLWVFQNGSPDVFWKVWCNRRYE